MTFYFLFFSGYLMSLPKNTDFSGIYWLQLALQSWKREGEEEYKKICFTLFMISFANIIGRYIN